MNFAPQFVADDGKADVAAVADHVEHIASVAGKQQYVHSKQYNHSYKTDCLYSHDSVGIGSDFDGIESTPKGLEDVSKYPALVSLHQSLSPYCGTNLIFPRSLSYTAEAGQESSLQASQVAISFG